MQSKKSTGGPHSHVARRLRHLRQTISGDNAARFAARIGMNYKRWNNFERGYPLSLDAAQHLCLAIRGLTLDYLYFGSPDGLSQELRSALDIGGDGDGSSSTEDRTKNGRRVVTVFL